MSDDDEEEVEDQQEEKEESNKEYPTHHEIEKELPSHNNRGYRRGFRSRGRGGRGRRGNYRNRGRDYHRDNEYSGHHNKYEHERSYARTKIEEAISNLVVLKDRIIGRD